MIPYIPSGWRPGDPIPPRNKKAVLYVILFFLALIAVIVARMLTHS